MKIEVCAKDNYSIFLNSGFMKGMDVNNKEELINFIKNFVFKIKNKLNLRGFYKIRVFSHDKVGVFLDVIKLDDIDLSNNLDLRIIIMNDAEIFFETDDYDVIADYNEKRYFDGKFYCIVDDLFDKIFEKVEWGRFIYGKDVVMILSKGIII